MSYGLNGSSQYGMSEGSDPIPAYPWAVVVWFKPTDLSTRGFPASFHNSGSGVPLMTSSLETTGYVNTFRRSNGNDVSLNQDSSAVSSGVWSMYAYIETGRTSRRAHVNATYKENTSTDLFANTPESLVRFGFGADVLRVGDGDVSGFFKGKIAHMAIWSYALTTEDIATLYNSGSGVSPTTVRNGNLTHYWPLTADANDTVGSINFTLYGSPSIDSDNPFSSSSVAPLSIMTPQFFGFNPGYGR